MTSPYAGGSAFPIPAVFDANRGEVHAAAAYGADAGMTLRDYFAARAPVESLENYKVDAVCKMLGVEIPTNLEDKKELRKFWFRLDCMLRYEWADAMIEERAKL